MSEAPFDPSGLRLLPASFFERDPEEVARDLLGTVLVTRIGGEVTGGVIVETEAYLGIGDPGSHAATKGITPRNRVLYGPPGRTYVYFTYGNHHMLNLVTCPEGSAGAVLVRAIEPVVGVAAMERRRGGRTGRELTSGPGKVAQALGITLEHNAIGLGREIAIYEGAPVSAGDVGRSGRIGLRKGHEMDLRFFVRSSPYVSTGKTGARPPRRRAK